MGLVNIIKEIGHTEVFYAPKAGRFCKGLALLWATMASVQIMGFISVDTFLPYIGLCLVSILYCLCDGSVQFKGRYVFLYLVFLFNVLVLPIEPCFNSKLRFVQFLIVTLACSACISSARAIIFRRYVFRYALMYICILSIGSFFAFFLGVNYMQVGTQLGLAEYSSNGGTFGGLVNHSMTLGPISMISALAFYVIYQNNNSKIFIVLFFLSAMSAVMAASRSALLGVAVAILFSLFFMKSNVNGNKKRIIIILCISALVAMPIADRVFAGVLNKQEQRKEQGGALSSRQSKFDCRRDEFMKSPLLGVGFVSVDPNGNDEYNPVTGQVEPGTSHLAVLSMTGLLGMFAYTLLLLNAYKTSKRDNSLNAQFVMLLLVAMFTHAWFEGYVLSAGGFLSMTYWMIVGQNIDCKYITEHTL